MKCEFSKFKKRPASSAIEFLVVFVILYTLFFTVVDIGLYFRQVYNVQTVSDEALSLLLSKNSCSSTDGIQEVKSTFADVIHNYYNKTPAFNVSSKNNNLAFKSGDDFTFFLTCRNEHTPQKLVFAYKYKGIFVYRDGVMINSTPSVNISYF